MRQTQRRLDKQAGFALIEAMLLVIIFAFIMLAIFRYEAWANRQTLAKTLGNQVMMLGNAVENRLAFDPTFKVGTYKGSQVIKALQFKECGGKSTHSYLPCDFHLNTALFSHPLKLVVSQDSHNTDYMIGTLTVGPIELDQNGVLTPAAYLAGAVTQQAQAYSANTSNRFLDATTSYNLDKKTGVITVSLVANQTNGDIFLRVDGKNDMDGNINFSSGATSQDINNVNTINLTGTNTSLDSYIKANRALNISNQTGSGIESNSISLSHSSGISMNSSQIIESSPNAKIHIQPHTINLETQKGSNHSSQDYVFFHLYHGSLTSLTNSTMLESNNTMGIQGWTGVYIRDDNYDNDTKNNNEIDLSTSGLGINNQNNPQPNQEVYLGNQSGTQGNSNVEINDMNIVSMGNQTLTSILNKLDVRQEYLNKKLGQILVTEQALQAQEAR